MPSPRRHNSLLSSLLAGGGDNGQQLAGRPYERRAFDGKIPGYRLELVATIDGDTVAYRAQLTRQDGTTSLTRNGSGLSKADYEVEALALIEELSRLGMVDPESEQRERPAGDAE